MRGPCQIKAGPCSDTTLVDIASASLYGSCRRVVSVAPRVGVLYRANACALRENGNECPPDRDIFYGISDAAPFLDGAIAVHHSMLARVDVVDAAALIGAIRFYIVQAGRWSGWATSTARGICEEAMEFAVDRLEAPMEPSVYRRGIPYLER